MLAARGKGLTTTLGKKKTWLEVLKDWWQAPTKEGAEIDAARRLLSERVHIKFLVYIAGYGFDKLKPELVPILVLRAYARQGGTAPYWAKTAEQVDYWIDRTMGQLSEQGFGDRKKLEQTAAAELALFKQGMETQKDG